MTRWIARKSSSRLLRNYRRYHGDGGFHGHFLLCHSVEIGLKAFLASRGVPVAKLKQDLRFRHNIAQLMRAASDKGLPIGVLAASEIMRLAEPHAKHWPRYPREEGKPVFAIENFEPYVRELLEAASQSIRGGPAQL